MTSKIKVDNINKVSDDSNIIKKCGTTTTIGSGASNPIVVDGSAVTIGRCGGTVALASGATQSGFGREGSVNWQTGSLKTTTFTAVSGEGYFINQGSAITMNLPAGSAGAIVAVSDYARNFATYNLTVSPNGSEKIGGIAQDAKLNIDGQAATFVYVDSTKGWINVQNAEDTETGVNPFIEATGGTVTTCGDFKVHTFTGPGSFAVTTAPTPGNNTTDYLVVGGGASGGGNGGGGGGAGGFRLSNDLCMPAPLTSPLANPTGLTITASTTYPITVGGGGSATRPAFADKGNDGTVSTFSTITSAGGGGGGGNNTPSSTNVGNNGGSGGGSGVLNPSHSPNGGPGSGNTPSVSPPQGQNGGAGHSPYSAPYAGGGGGGAGAVGGPGVGDSGDGGAGSYVIQAGFAGCNGTPGPVGSTRYFAGGGGSGKCGPGPGTSAGDGGDGGGGRGTNANNGAAISGTTNTGGGGGGQGGYALAVGAGGSGIVIIRYKFQ